MTPRGVWITRPAGDAAETAGRVAERGLVPVVAPILTIRPVAADLPPPGTIQAVLAPSRNAVRALPRAWRTRPLLAVGDATAAEARLLGFTEIHSAAADGAALASLAAARCDARGRPLLLASGVDRGARLAALTRARGFVVEHRAVYDAVPVASLPHVAEEALRDGTLAAALFFSAETARAGVRLVRDAGLAATVARVLAVAIGHPARVALGALDWRAISVAPRPMQDDMLTMLDALER